jgi:hypothetical protein
MAGEFIVSDGDINELPPPLPPVVLLVVLCEDVDVNTLPIATDGLFKPVILAAPEGLSTAADAATAAAAVDLVDFLVVSTFALVAVVLLLVVVVFVVVVGIVVLKVVVFVLFALTCAFSNNECTDLRLRILYIYNIYNY